MLENEIIPEKGCYNCEWNSDGQCEHSKGCEDVSYKEWDLSFMYDVEFSDQIKVSNKESCLKMWTWLADNPRKIKEDYFKGNVVGAIPPWYCYACAEVREHNNNDCYFCPIEWIEGEYGGCTHEDSPYYLWLSIARSDKERSLYAKEIIELIKNTWED